MLLGKRANWPVNRYSLLAGFVEPGESLEQCADREVLEEVGVVVDELRYVGSQSWPFPSQLMIGFTARYASGEVVVDREELESADWFELDNLPALPPPLSIARQILEQHYARRALSARRRQSRGSSTRGVVAQTSLRASARDRVGPRSRSSAASARRTARAHEHAADRAKRVGRQVAGRAVGDAGGGELVRVPSVSDASTCAPTRVGATPLPE